MAVAGLELTEGAPQLDDPIEPGDIIHVNGCDHAVLGVRGYHDIEQDQWKVVVKLGALREPEVQNSGAPEWVTDFVLSDT